MYFKCVKIKTNVPVEVDEITCLGLYSAKLRCKNLEKQNKDKDSIWSVLSSEDMRELKRSGFTFNYL